MVELYFFLCICLCSIASESSICLLSFFIDVLMYLRGQIQNMCLSDTAADTDDGLVSQSRGNK
jgi:hypothetical protein